tara:strand:+ start:20 stop:808 length:789 start_codon:yes stop_codon:yes gene_type:complete
MLKKLIDFIVFGNIWISLGAVGVSIFTFILCDINIDIYYLNLVFFATLFSYNLQNLSQRIIHNERSKQMVWIQSNYSALKVIILVSLFSAAVFAYSSLSWIAVSLSLPFLFLVIFYRFSLFKQIKLRTIPGIKIFIIAMCWSWTCSLLPQLLFTNQINWLVVLFVLIYVFVITIPFDIRDMSFDEQIHTIPQMIGLKKSFILLMTILLILLSYFIFRQHYKLALFLLITLLILLPSIKKNNNEYYYLLLIDGLLILMPIFVL